MDRSSIQQLDDLIGTDRPAPVIPRQARRVPRAAKGLSSRIAEELAAPRHGYGLFASRIDALVGPAIREMCGMTVGDDPEEIRWKVEVQLRDLSACLPDELRTAAVGAFAIHPGTTLLPAGRLAVLVRQLANAHLMQRNGSVRYRMHDLIRLYAAEQVGDGEVEALRRLISFYVHATYFGERLLYPDRKPTDIGPSTYEVPVFTDDVSTLTWFDVELPCLLVAQTAAARQGWHEFVRQLAWTLHSYLWRRGHLQEQLTTWRTGLAAAQQLGDPALQGLAHRLLGQGRTACQGVRALAPSARRGRYGGRVRSRQVMKK